MVVCYYFWFVVGWGVVCSGGVWVVGCVVIVEGYGVWGLVV